MELHWSCFVWHFWYVWGLPEEYALDVVSVGRVEDERVVGRDRRRNGHGHLIPVGFIMAVIGFFSKDS